MVCPKCGREDLREEVETKLRWLEYERDMIKEEGTKQELFWIDKKILKLNKAISMSNILKS